MAKCLLWLVLPPLLTKGSATPPFRKGRWVGASRAGGFESCRATPLRKGVSQLPLNPPSRLRRDTSLCEREAFVTAATSYLFAKGRHIILAYN